MHFPQEQHTQIAKKISNQFCSHDLAETTMQVQYRVQFGIKD